MSVERVRTRAESESSMDIQIADEAPRAVGGRRRIRRAASAPAAKAPVGVQLRDIHHAYDGVPSLKGVTLDIHPGELVTLLGASGSGKSTLLRTLAGLTPTTSGSVWIGGRDVTRVAPEHRETGFVFQDYALFPHLTVFENIAYPLRIRKLSERAVADKVAEILEVVELGALAQRRPGELSGGQQQRVAVARAIVFEPSVLLLDEPLGALDRRLRQSLAYALRRIHRETGLTSVYVTHDQEEAFLLSDRIAVMEDGHIRQIGTPSEIYWKPVDLFVARFVGYLNQVDGQVVADGPNGAVRLADGTVLQDVAVPDGIGAGQDVVCGIRPECLVAGRPDGHGETGPSFRGVVRESAFKGATSEFVVDTELGDLAVERPSSGELWKEGDPITLSWAMTNMHVFGRAPTP